MDPQTTPPSFFMPHGVSTFAHNVDSLYSFILWLSTFFFVLIVALMAVFIVRYRRRSEDDKTPHISHNTPLELTWTILPTLLLFVLFFWGFDKYMQLRVPPSTALEVHVTARRWAWNFAYPDGTQVATEFAVPVNEPVRLIMRSEDVIHSFFVPEFRQKMDVLPNRYTTTWFEATVPGTYNIFCAEYCGASHSEMLGRVLVMERPQYEEWLSTGGVGDVSKLTMAERGAIWYRRFTCNTCHSVDGSAKTGPTWKGLFGHEVQLADGRTVAADADYIRKSIDEPAADVVAGFTNSMPTFKGQIKESEMNDLIEYIKSLQ